MSKLKSEKYKGWTIKFSKLRNNVFTEIVKGSYRYDIQVSSTKEEGLAKAKAGIDQLENKKKKKNMATFSGSGNKYIGWIFHISTNAGKDYKYETFNTISEAKAYFKKNNFSVDWRGLK